MCPLSVSPFVMINAARGVHLNANCLAEIDRIAEVRHCQAGPSYPPGSLIANDTAECEE